MAASHAGLTTALPQDNPDFELRAGTMTLTPEDSRAPPTGRRRAVMRRRRPLSVPHPHSDPASTDNDPRRRRRGGPPGGRPPAVLRLLGPLRHLRRLRERLQARRLPVSLFPLHAFEFAAAAAGACSRRSRRCFRAPSFGPETQPPPPPPASARLVSPPRPHTASRAAAARGRPAVVSRLSARPPVRSACSTSRTRRCWRR